MDTHVNTPQAIFNLPQRLLVPLFQRPYVWDEDRQWRPLWQDVERVAEKVLAQDQSARHFLGAVVLQQESNSTGTLVVRTIIDGQQRLTTLQLLFDAILEEIRKLGFDDISRRLVDLVENSTYQRRLPEDQFKVWPTNRDREAFVEVMSTDAPVYSTLKHKGSKLVKAHAYFAAQAAAWLGEDADLHASRASALVDAVATRLQIVSIDLKSDEDAQEIFETLNARGTPLTAADLIKNLVFQRLNASPEESEASYHAYWEQFETPFWEAEVSSGRVLWSRSSLFLTQWLAAQTQQDIPTREVFAAFKRFIDDHVTDVNDLLAHIRSCADIYQSLIEGAAKRHEPLTPLEMFTYRIGEMQSEILRPVLIWLTDPNLPQIPDAQLFAALDALESWLVRRTLVREKTAGHNRFIIDLLQEIADSDRAEIGSRIADILMGQTADASYWPDDEAVRNSLADMQIYRRISRARLRMILEAVEDHRRGFSHGRSSAKGEQPVVRAQCTIEHVMPQRWGQHWPLAGDESASERDAIVQTLGNLTLVSESLNPSLSNAGWGGEKGKRQALLKYSSIKLTSEIIELADQDGGHWTESLIEDRTSTLIEEILAIWPTPRGHTNDGRHGGTSESNISIRDLMKAELLAAGQVLVPGSAKWGEHRAVVMADAQIEYEGRLFETPSGAGRAAIKRTVNGWWFWKLEGEQGPRLIDLRAHLVSSGEELEVGPFDAQALAGWADGDSEGLEELALSVTSALPKLDTVFPAQFGKGEFRAARYWAHGHGEPNVCVGIPRDPLAEAPDVPIWARYVPNTPGFQDAKPRLEFAVGGDLVVDDAGSLWIPLDIDPLLKDQALIDDLAMQVRDLDRIARGEELSDVE